MSKINEVAELVEKGKAKLVGPAVQEAIDAVPDFRKNIRTTILVRKGVYKEKIVVPESKINISCRSIHIYDL